MPSQLQPLPSSLSLGAAPAPSPLPPSFAPCLQLREWKMVFEKRERRPPSRADMLMAAPEIRNLARRLGLLDAL